MQHIVRRAGMTLYSDVSPQRRGESHVSSMAAGLHFGLVTAGRLITEDSRLGSREWGPGDAVFFWQEGGECNHVMREDGTLAAFFVHVLPADLPGLAERAGGRPPPGWLCTGAGEIRLSGCDDGGALLRSVGLVAAPWRQAPPAESVMVVAACRLMARLLAEAGYEMPGAALSPAELARLCRARDLLLCDMREPPTMEALARHLGTNPGKLNSGFRLLYGQTPYAWLKERRLADALDRLRRDERPVLEIARDLGWGAAHLATAFRARFGCSPRQYRLSSARRRAG